MCVCGLDDSRLDSCGPGSTSMDDVYIRMYYLSRVVHVLVACAFFFRLIACFSLLFIEDPIRNGMALVPTVRSK